MDGGSDQWPAIDGTSNHEWDRPKPLTGPPTSGSQNVVNDNNDNNDNNDDDNTINAIRHALATMMMPRWHHYHCCSMPNIELPQLKAGILVVLVYSS
jgi:hypothetical protein